MRQIIEAGNSIARTPYKWGGGHGKWQDTGYDCSGSVSFALAAAGLLEGPLASGPLMSWGKPGRGKWVTIYSNPGHVYLEVAGIRFDTSGARATGSRWQNELRRTPASSPAIRPACRHAAPGVPTPSCPRGGRRLRSAASFLLKRTGFLMTRSHHFALPAGPPPEVQDEIDAAWERAQALVDGAYELRFDAIPRCAAPGAS